MSRATRARRIAAAAAYGGGGLGMLGAAGFGLLMAEAKLARRWIGRPERRDSPAGDQLFGSGTGRMIEFAMLGDSSAAGLGADRPDQTPGAVIAAGLAAITGRPVRLTVVAMIGAESTALDGQVDRLLADRPALEAAVIMIGVNDVTHRVRPAVAVRALGAAVARLREAGAEVVVGTCPDLGTIDPIAPPLRHLARRLSRQLAAAQTIAVVEAGGRTVSLGDLLGPEFAASPREMFSPDRFHPSAAGYARAAAVLLPSVLSALDLWPNAQPSWPSAGRVDVDDVAHAAARASRTAGTEVVGTEVDGSDRGPRGRWAVASLRRGAAVVASTAASTASTVANTASTVLTGARAIIPGAPPAAAAGTLDGELPAGKLEP
jgi:lysophospholipase L1-like esterase